MWTTHWYDAFRSLYHVPCLHTQTVRHTNTTSAHLNLLNDSAQIIQAIHLSPGQHTGSREELWMGQGSVRQHTGGDQAGWIIQTGPERPGYSWNVCLSLGWWLHPKHKLYVWYLMIWQIMLSNEWVVNYGNWPEQRRHVLLLWDHYWSGRTATPDWRDEWYWRLACSYIQRNHLMAGTEKHNIICGHCHSFLYLYLFYLTETGLDCRCDVLQRLVSLPLWLDSIGAKADGTVKCHG